VRLEPARILITGAGGFVGRDLVARLAREGRSVRVAVRRHSPMPAGVESLTVGDIGPATDWTRAVADVDAVVHLAARVHVGRESPRDWPLFHAVNAAGAGALARAARAAGARKFVHMSTTTVYGDRSLGKPFDEASPTAPVSLYARSKLEGEQLVMDALAGSASALVIVRPPLVYGADARGNFGRLVTLVQSGMPLPFASIRNTRSLLYVSNLVDALLKTLDDPRAGGVYVVSDGQDVSTPELIARIGRAIGATPRLFACPPALLRAAARLLGKAHEGARLLGDMALDGSRIRRELGWQPPFSLDEGLRRSVRKFQVAG
jgi:nucleoside-diphosphate-sugar epimerase